MTKGEWKKAGYLWVSKDTSQQVRTHFADELAKVSAVNNTYGKGINPEGVEKMKSNYEKIDAELSKPQPDLRIIVLLVEEALTAAKL